jgi:hypothetical protein
MSLLQTLSLAFCLWILGGTYCNVLAQKIEISPANSDRIVRVETALNHLTVIEVPETITTVAAGSPAFKIERRENKVFIQPLEEGESTNLFIWTAARRYSYELAPAGNVSAMHFAIDHRESASSIGEHSPAELKTESNESASDALLRSIPVRWQGSRPDENRVAVEFRDVLKLTDRWLIRYAVVNRSAESYPLRKPQIALMNSPASKFSLLPLSGAQLGPREASHVRSDDLQRLESIQAKTEADFVAPGREAIGVVGIAPLVENPTPSVLQFEFPADQRGRVLGMLVL